MLIWLIDLSILTELKEFTHLWAWWLPSMGSHRVGHDWSDLAAAAAATNKCWLPRWDTEPTCQCRRHERPGFDPWVRKIPRRREQQPTPVFLPGESHGQRSLVGYCPRATKSWTQLKWLSTHKHARRPEC